MSLFEFSESKVMGNPTAIHLRLDLSEKERLKEYAENEDLNLSNFLRKCINFYIDSLEGNVNTDDGVVEIDYLMDYADNNLPSHFTCTYNLTKREGYYMDDEGYEYFMGEHVEMDYTDPIELRRTPDKYIEFRLLDDDRGFVRACYDIWNINHLT